MASGSFGLHARFHSIYNNSRTWNVNGKRLKFDPKLAKYPFHDNSIFVDPSRLFVHCIFASGLIIVVYGKLYNV